MNHDGPEFSSDSDRFPLNTAIWFW